MANDFVFEDYTREDLINVVRDLSNALQKEQRGIWLDSQFLLSWENAMKTAQLTAEERCMARRILPGFVALHIPPAAVESIVAANIRAVLETREDLTETPPQAETSEGWCWKSRRVYGPTRAARRPVETCWRKQLGWDANKESPQSED